MINGAFPDVVVKEEDLLASGDRVIERSSATATHRSSMMGEQPTNKRVVWSEIHIYRLRDGKVSEHWAEISTMELLQQIGVLPQLGQSTHTAD
jgi:predicted ester cyclase